MDAVENMTKNKADSAQASSKYQIEAWSEGYFAINHDGQVMVHPKGSRTETGVSLDAIKRRLKAHGMDSPVLVRFPEILQHRVHTLTQAFDKAIKTHQYQGEYTPVYPIKVNQHRRVVETLANAHPNAGLESGSKPELMAVIAMMQKPNGKIICNGYKDREYIELALIATQLGYDVVIIIEKLSECQLVCHVANEMQITPKLGLRVRLASISKGKWQNTGGEKSKFGLTATQALTCLEHLNKEGFNECMQVLHVHLGSQIANIRDIQQGLAECARFYVALHQAGAPLNTIDVGGGLGVDYEGSHSRRYCSMNYSIDEYANKVVHAFTEICDAEGYPHPNIITESGRAMTAHHAVLMTNLIGIEEREPTSALPELPKEAPALLSDLYQTFENCHAQNAIECYHNSQYAQQECHSLFTHGLLSLSERALVEQCVSHIAKKVRQFLSADIKSHREILDLINQQLAQRLYTNFSLFQSLPDIWAIEQIFPILPIDGLNHPLSKHAIIHDITCDSDGRIDNYIHGEDIEQSLALPAIENQNMTLCFFLVGAYQEILGDMHNLFGDTHTVHVISDASDPQGFRLLEPVRGQSIADVLTLLQFDPEHLLGIYRDKLARSGLSQLEQETTLALLQSRLSGYTYLINKES